MGWRGPEHRLYRLCRAGALQLAISAAVVSELERVLSYPKLGLDEADIRSFLEDVRNHARMVEPQDTVEAVSADPDDNRIIECAIAADAHWIVSGDKHLLTLKSFRDIQIITTATALQLLDEPA